MNLKLDVDLGGEFPPIREIKAENRRLNLAASAPCRCVLPHERPGRTFDGWY